MTLVLMLLLGMGLLMCVGVAGVGGYFVFVPAADVQDAAPVARANPPVIANPPPNLKPAAATEWTAATAAAATGGTAGQQSHGRPERTQQAIGNIAFTDPISQFGGPHKVYAVNLQAGQTYQIDMIARELKGKANSFDPYLYLLDDQKKVLAEDNDGGGEPNARIVYRAERTGDYRIIATHFGDLKGAGHFTLTVRPLEAVGKSLVANLLNLNGFQARELTLGTNITAPLVGTEPCWDAQGNRSTG